MPGALLWGWDNTNKVWIPLQVDTNGYVKVDMSNVNLDDLADVSVASPTDGYVIYWDNANSLWKAKKVGGSNLGQTFGASDARLLNYVPTPISGYAVYILHCAGGAFAGAIDDNAGAHGGQGLDATHVPYDGDSNEDFFNGLSAYDGVSPWGQFILHNTTKGESCKIVSVDRTNNVIVVTADSPDDVSAWADNDVITCQSQTNARADYVEISLSDNIPTTVDAAFIIAYLGNQTATDDPQNVVYIHPYEAYDVGKQQSVRALLANEASIMPIIMNIESQKLTIKVRTDGVDDFNIFLTIAGYFEYADT